MEFSARHLGPNRQQRQQMLQLLGFKDLEEFVHRVIPRDILRPEPMQLPAALGEHEALARLKAIGAKNQRYRSLIGQGYYDTIVPPVILRNILENPSWYTSYTPYQPEISQGRLEMLLNFQTLISDLTGFPIANASLLDEATAAAEAMLMARRHSKKESHKFFVHRDVHPQTLAVIQTRARFQNIDVEVGERADGDYFGALFSYPASSGEIYDLREPLKDLKGRDTVVILACDLLALTLLQPPAALGADIAIGSAQRFGVPLGGGGPHAAFMATTDDFKRTMPGRLVGVSKDSRGRPALRLALQTREQHIRREKATSNVCTAQALLAIMAAAYAIYHGPDGLSAIAGRINRLTNGLARSLSAAGFKVLNGNFFDTLHVDLGAKREEIIKRAAAAHFNFRLFADGTVAIALDEKSTEVELAQLLEIFGAPAAGELQENLPAFARRTDEFLTHPVFHQYRNETAMMRYLKKLSDWDLALDRTMIPLGSCTMKLNAAAEMLPISWPEFTDLHPFAPAEQSAGLRQLLGELEQMLTVCTGYDGVSLQPNSGAQGEYAGLIAIRRYQEDQGQGRRHICLIPASAHGTNPASAALAGLQVEVVACDGNGQVDLEDLRRKTAAAGDRLSCIMVTYPSTHGAFEPQIREICRIIHAGGGQVYLDGANLNAQVGWAAPGLYGADVSHLNLHKTFAIPHGGGGPGVGPVCAKAHLLPYLPGGEKGLPVSAAPYGSALVTLISHMYLAMMGAAGLREASAVAILNANYIAKRLEGAFPILYRDENGLVAHECIVDLRPLKEASGISAEDVAKRLMDYGFHAPTMSFPVAGTLMIEPTESEDLAELERFCAAMLAIREEIAKVESGQWPRDNNPLTLAPHTLADLVEDWQRPYDRSTAVFPVAAMNPARYFPPVNRVDNPYGDRVLVCTCPPLSD